MLFNSALSERAIGQYPLSIATSLAMEGLTGINEVINENRIVQPLLENIPSLWVNVFTLARNLVGSIAKEAVNSIVPEELVPVLMQEMAVIKDIAEQKTNFRSKVTFYFSHYEGMEKKYPHALLRSPTTDLQKINANILHEACLQLIDEAKGSQTPVEVYKLKLDIKVPQPKSFILTHIPYDLLSSKHFQELLLIESHTGRVKAKPLWYTKYHKIPKESLLRIPFREDLLQIFGDNETFKPLSIHIRRRILEAATNDRWSFMTTKDKIEFSLEKLKDPEINSLVKNFF